MQENGFILYLCNFYDFGGKFFNLHVESNYKKYLENSQCKESLEFY